MASDFIYEALYSEDVTRTVDVILDDGTEVDVILKFKDKNGKELGTHNDTAYAENNNISYPFNIEEIANKINAKEAEIDHLTVAIDIDDDGVIATGEVCKLKVLPLSKIDKLYLSYMQPPKPKTYEVKENDTLSKIAQKYNTTYQELAALNSISNPNIIYPEQVLIIPSDKEKEAREIKLNGSNIVLGTKVNVIASGVKNTKATVEVLVDDKPFKVLYNGSEVTQLEIELDERGQFVGEVELRPKDDEVYKQLIDTFAPQVGQPVKTEKITLKSEINGENRELIYQQDDYNTIGLNQLQAYIKSAYIVDPLTGRVQTTLTVQQAGDEIIFSDEKTGEPTAKAPLDEITNTFGNVNNGLGGLAAGMEYVDGSFALSNSKGISLKHYESGWYGNQYVKTYSMAKWGSRLSNGTNVISLVIGYIQIDSAMDKDEAYLDEHNISRDGYTSNVGEQAEQQISSTLAGLGGGVISGYIALGILSLPFIPIEVGTGIVIGTFVVVGTAVGWAISEGSSALIEWEQSREGNTILHDYPLKDK